MSSLSPIKKLQIMELLIILIYSKNKSYKFTFFENLGKLNYNFSILYWI